MSLTGVDRVVVVEAIKQIKKESVVENKYKDWIDIIKNAVSALFVAFWAQIANIFYFNGDEKSLIPRS